MTLWCVACKRHVSSPCASHRRPGDHRRSLSGGFRSTKSASKARRDHINHEIRNMRALLPIPQEDQERLSYLHSMAAICAYIRKSVLFQGLPAGGRSQCSLPYEAFLQALHGFILVTTAQGRLVYVSENVSEYLGFSMLDVLQGDTFYDMVERSDVEILKSSLDVDNSSLSERSFVCCMQTSKAFRLQHGSCCSMLVRGSFRCLPQPQPSPFGAPRSVFVALCTPTANRLSLTGPPHHSHSFSSTHRLDMSFTHVSDSVSFLLGCPSEDLIGRSWYSLVHPEDLSSCDESHRSLMQADEGFQVEMVLRLQRADLSWSWMYIRANKDSEFLGISCTNFVISETEAKFLGKRISSEAFRPSLAPNACQFTQEAPHSQSHNAKCFKRQRTPSSQGEERGVRARTESERDGRHVAPRASSSSSPSSSSPSSSQGNSSPVSVGDSPALVSPPYSPASSGSPVWREELGRDLLMDADQLLSSPESTPSYYSYPEAGFTCHRSPSDSLPAGAAEQAFDRGPLGMLGASTPLSSSSPTYDFQACTSDARLVPDCLSASDMCEGPLDCVLHPDDFGLLEQPPGSGLVQLHHVPQCELPVHAGLLTPSRSPISTESNQYSEREQVEISILAQQISSLASSFVMHHSLSPLDPPAPSDALPPCDWHRKPPVSSEPLPKHELLLDGEFDSLLKDLDMVSRKIHTPGAPGVVSYGYQQGPACSRGVSQELEPGPLGLISEDQLQLGHHDQNTGLHQLNHYMQSNLLQDGLAEENLY